MDRDFSQPLRLQSYGYWQQIEPVHICPTFNWHLSLSTPQDLSAPLHPSPLVSPSTSALIICLSTCGPTLHPTISPLLQQPLIPLSTPSCVFQTLLLLSSHHRVSTPTSISLPLPETLLSLSLTQPCYFVLQTAQSGIGSISRQSGSIHTCLCLSQCLNMSAPVIEVMPGFNGYGDLKLHHNIFAT